MSILNGFPFQQVTDSLTLNGGGVGGGFPTPG